MDGRDKPGHDGGGGSLSRSLSNRRRVATFVFRIAATLFVMAGLVLTAVRHGSCLKVCTAMILLVSRWLRINWTRKGTKAVPHQNIVFHSLLKHIPWAVVDQLVDEHEADRDPRALTAKCHLIAMLYAQFSGARGLREIATRAAKPRWKALSSGGYTVSKSTLSTAKLFSFGRGVLAACSWR